MATKQGEGSRGPYGDHIDPNRFSGTQEHHAEYLIRTCLRYEVLEAALDHTLSMTRRVSADGSHSSAQCSPSPLVGY